MLKEDDERLLSEFPKLSNTYKGMFFGEQLAKGISKSEIQALLESKGDSPGVAEARLEKCLRAAKRAGIIARNNSDQNDSSSDTDDEYLVEGLKGTTGEGWWNYDYNKDTEQRDSIIFGKYDAEAYDYGLRRFYISLDKLKQLIAGRFIDVRYGFNAAPSPKEIYNFMKKYPEYLAHGYAIPVQRDDYRVSLEGVAKGGIAKSAKELEGFREVFLLADEVTLWSRMYCWFD